MKILHITIKKKWFDLIASGEKKEEYREIKDYWIRRLKNKTYDAILFRNGYSKNSPKLLIVYDGYHTGLGRIKWGAPEGKPVFILSLGEIIK